jgi:redox-sensitive bicupin YhaK (pirin superfamily)
MKRPIKAVIKAIREDISDLKTFRAMPTNQLEMVDPFLFLNHHGHQVYSPQNSGLPFGPHPHRGFETVTFILEGDIAHKDSGGHESVIDAGGVQWMTAGRGLIHSEISSEAFKKKGGSLEILQLWVNLPKRLKMTAPKYEGLQKDQITQISEDAGRVKISLTSGSYGEHVGAVKPLTDVTTMTLSLKENGEFKVSIPKERNIFFYVISGSVEVNETKASQHEVVLFKNENEELLVQALSESKVLLCHARPLNEPVVSYGPFVMNTHEDIQQAIEDYQAGRF